MRIESLYYEKNTWKSDANIGMEADIVFTYGSRDTFKSVEAFESLKSIYPNAQIVGCSSSGNILGNNLSDSQMVASAIYFDTGSVQVVVEDFEEKDDQVLISKKLIKSLKREDLKHVYILSDGLNMNGSSLALGANEALEYKVAITGGLAGDGTEFEETWVIANDVAKQNRVVAVGFYGDSLDIRSGCYGGWEEFGILRNITKSMNNIVYEIDNQPALELYKKYLGDYAKDLPSAGLRFPISIIKNEGDTPIVRTLLGIDEESQSLIFAGDVPKGSLARLMKTDIDGLIDGAEIAAKEAKADTNGPALGLVVSCVGRRLVLNQLTDEELEGVASTLGENVILVGFYSYGELAPFSDELLSCHLHNQTLTLTVVSEVE